MRYGVEWEDAFAELQQCYLNCYNKSPHSIKQPFPINAPLKVKVWYLTLLSNKSCSTINALLKLNSIRTAMPLGKNEHNTHISLVKVIVSKVSNSETSAWQRRSIVHSNYDTNSNLVDQMRFG